MDEQHVLAAARYIERNPLAAGMCSGAADWPWSSARAHLSGKDDALVEVGQLCQAVGNWRRFLGDGRDDEVGGRIHRHTRTGRPLGDDSFIARIEGIVGRGVRVRPRGRPAKKEIQ